MHKQLSNEARSEIYFENIEEADCGVVAVQTVTGLSRKGAIKLLSGGYVRGVGTSSLVIKDMLYKNGYVVDPIAIQPGEHTPALFSSVHERGRFLLFTESHVMALVDGDLFNARGHWHHVLFNADRITKGAK